MKQVVKIGGSLFPDYAIDLARHLKNTDSLIILGGGEFANLIRKYDSEINFSQKTSHWTAIDCMDIIAKLVNDKVESTKLAYSIDEVQKISDEGFTPIFVVSGFLRCEDPFECSWNVTSDSIAAYISHLLNANLLIVTNVNGIYTHEPKESGSTFISKIDAKTLLNFQESSIDVMLPSLLLKFGTDCYVVNGKYPERVLSLIDDNINDYNFDYTQIIGD
ncbi:MAG: delta 1-pyrroline-5-carboxylate synthetase [archaeon]|uniref:amino acid kinase family protein n=1 Tax=Methanobrevibacter TaxID=2172 RepID=UPI00084C4C34|nr:MULTISPECIES: delta 1-pyrroline-5-carboxylate synthetase [Methanobrevibacter]MCQ2970329.1 delta 1-pyrroline-5-carboxylate synthetase [archaeon]OEC95279.1 delta 1-pyrroline-5-carboxylate synthetase [Methanobrevibacter sp. A27]